MLSRSRFDYAKCGMRGIFLMHRIGGAQKGIKCRAVWVLKIFESRVSRLWLLKHYPSHLARAAQ